MSNYNAAQRIHSIFAEALRSGPNARVFDVWAMVFGVEVTEDIERQYQIIEALRLVRNEAILLQTTIVNAKMNQERYVSVFESIHRSLNVHYVGAAWSDVIPHLNAGVMATLNVFADVLSDDSRELNEEERKEMIGILEDAEEEANSKDLPEHVRRFLRHHIIILLNALRHHKIAGDKIFREALGSLVAMPNNIRQARNDVNINEKASTIYEAVKRVWLWSMARAAEADTMHSLSEVARKFLEG